MRFSSFAALVVASSALQSVSAGPLAKRQDTESSSSSTAPTAALFPSTLSDGSTTTVEALVPTRTAARTSASETPSEDTTTEASSTASEAPTRTNANTSPTQSSTLTDEFPACEDAKTGPFCLPANESTLYVGNSYYVTWNPDLFPVNSTITVKLLYDNSTTEEAWTSKPTENNWGMTAITMLDSFRRSYTRYNLTFYAFALDPSNPSARVQGLKGPTIELRERPIKHYEPPKKTNPNKLGLAIGLPVGLGFVVLIVLGLWIGMRKRRTIGLGNVMGRRGHGYGERKSRRQRVGRGKGAIRLEEQEIRSPEYRDDARGHARGDSLGSLVSEDAITPAGGRGNHFRDEVQRQKTGGR